MVGTSIIFTVVFRSHAVLSDDKLVGDLLNDDWLVGDLLMMTGWL